MACGTDGKPAERTTGAKDRFWEPRLWSGMTLSGYFALMARNHFAVSPRRVPMAFILGSISLVNSFLWGVQMLWCGRKIRRTVLAHEPIFIIGHWRAGTTLLHELLVLDSRHAYPDTYACFAPNHFLVSSRLIRPWLKYLLPARRWMDNMAAGWDRPQEDEFALCNMGVRSPYLTIAFSNRPPQDQEYLDFAGVPQEALARWKDRLLWFLKCLTVRQPKPIVLKSPTHTCRIRALLDVFPRARFIHIVRDPCVLYPSTVNLWRRLYRIHGFQMPKYRGLEEHVLRTFERMYAAFESDRHLIPCGQLAEVRYEDLVQRPIDEMHRIYEQLGLGEFARVQPALEAYFAAQVGYQTNRFVISPETRAEISRRWGAYLDRYGYADVPAKA